MSEPVKLRKDLPGATVRMDDPASRNALGREMVAGLQQAFEDLHGEQKVRAVILTGGDSFCSGTDLRALADDLRVAETQPEVLAKWHEEVAGLLDLFRFMLQFPKPLIAAVNGDAAGNGLALALVCDYVIGGTSSRYSVPEARRGLVPGFVAPLLAWRSGAAIARRMVLGAATLSASEALAAGVIDEVVHDDLVWARANEQVAVFADTAPSSVQITRLLCNETIGESLLVQLASGAANMASARSTEAARRGVDAFVEKRTVDWSQRPGA
jgi:methylglutaconyl-CoA hydratase